MKAELFAKGEPDLQLSVYEVVVESEDALRKRIVQVSAEHAISPPLDPKTLAHFDVSGLHPAVPEPGNTLFAFTRAAHRVLSFRDAGALRSFANGLRTAALQGTRLWKVSRDEMLDYAIARLDAGDGEWENAVERVSTSSGASCSCSTGAERRG